MPSPSKTPIERSNPRGPIRINPPTAGGTASPTIPRQPSFLDNALNPSLPRSPTPTVTPSPINEPRFIPRLDVSPSPPVDVDQQVTFTVVPKLPGAVEYRFNFGDGKTSEWITEPLKTHQYGATKLYFAYAEIRRPEGRLAFGTINTARKEVEVRPRSSPTPSATASLPITPSPYSPSPTAIVPGGFITATPSVSRANVGSPIATRSPRKPTTVTASPFSNGGPPQDKRWPIYYIVGAGVAAAALYGMLKLIKPTFRPRWNRGEPQRPPENLTINYRLHFDSNVSRGQHWLEIDGPVLILRKTIQ